MSETFQPPGWTERVRAASVLVLAPHYDDEVLGCGGLIAGLAAAGAPAVVRVLFLTDSRGGAATTWGCRTAVSTSISTRRSRESGGRSSPSGRTSSSSPRPWRSPATIVPSSPLSTACWALCGKGTTAWSRCTTCASSSTRSTTPAIRTCWWT